MKQSLVILVIASLFIGCAKHSKIKNTSYDYLFDGNLEPVNTKEEKDKVLGSVGILDLENLQELGFKGE